MNKTLTLVLAYAVVAFLTFASAYDGMQVVLERDEPIHQMGSVAAAIAWPIYWGGTVALIAVRTAKAPATCK